MLMPALVWTPIQHELQAARTPFLIPVQYLTSQSQDYKSLPHSQSRFCPNIEHYLLYLTLLNPREGGGIIFLSDQNERGMKGRKN